MALSMRVTRRLESQLGSFPAAFGELYLAMNVSLRSKHQAPKRLVAVMPRRGLSAVDGVEGLPRGGKQRAQIFTRANQL